MTSDAFEQRLSPRGDTAAIEAGELLMPKFGPDGLVAAVAVDAATNEVLMVAWMNAEALVRTIETGEAYYYSRSRQELWHKGATSGHVQRVVELRVDCDQDSVVLRVETAGAINCHTGHRSCYYRAAEIGQESGPLTLRPVD